MIKHEVSYQHTAILTKEGIQIGTIWLSHDQFQKLQSFYNANIESMSSSHIHMDTG